MVKFRPAATELPEPRSALLGTIEGTVGAEGRQQHLSVDQKFILGDWETNWLTDWLTVVIDELTIVLTTVFNNSI